MDKTSRVAVAKAYNGSITSVMFKISCSGAKCTLGGQAQGSGPDDEGCARVPTCERLESPTALMGPWLSGPYVSFIRDL